MLPQAVYSPALLQSALPRTLAGESWMGMMVSKEETVKTSRTTLLGLATANDPFTAFNFFAGRRILRGPALLI